jgi:hypothetical protein
MEPNKTKEGVSVKEIETFARKHCCEVFLCLSFIFACVFSFVFFGSALAMIGATVGGLVGVLMAGKVEFFFKKALQFVFKQEKTIQILLGVVGLILSIFLPPLIFLSLGMYGGKSLLHTALEHHSQQRK